MAVTHQEALSNLISNFNKMITATEELNKDGSPLRSRELSLAITHMEEAEHWMEHLDARLSPPANGKV